MQDRFNKIFTYVEQIIITLIEENRYSFQLFKSINLLSVEMNIPLKQLDCSIESLWLIDEYLNNLKKTERLDLEVYLSITIYFSQVLILSCNGIWSIIEHEKCLLPGRNDFYAGDEEIWIYSLTIEIYPTSFSLYPHYTAMKNIEGNKSELEQEVISFASEFKNYQIEEVYYHRYELSGLETLIYEGFDFYSEIPSLISKLADLLNIPRNKLNKSVNSLKLVSDPIRVSGEFFLCDQEFFDEISFLVLLVYIGEVIIKAVDGEWRISAEKVHKGEIRKYRWTMKLFNSEDRELTGFLFNVSSGLTEHTYRRFSADSLVKYYVRANQEQDDTIWRDTTPYPKTRVWKKVLEHIY